MFDGASGTFYGLNDAIGTSSASSFDLKFDDGNTWTGVDASLLFRNEFVFSSVAVLATIVFDIDTPLTSDDGAVLLEYFYMFIQNSGSDTAQAEYFLLPSGDRCPDCYVEDDGPFNEPLDFLIVPATVPLPAGGLLLLSGLAGVAALKRRKKRAA